MSPKVSWVFEIKSFINNRAPKQIRKHIILAMWIKQRPIRKHLPY